MIAELFKTLFYKVIFVILFGEARNRFLRLYGTKIGKGCEIHASDFSTEPFLVEIGDCVSISAGTTFITHDGSVRIMRDEIPEIDLFGKIVVGENTFIGQNCVILPNTHIGKGCIIGAGAVVRGFIPDDCVVIGNPARVIMKTDLIKSMFLNHKNSLKTKHLTRKKKMQMIRRHFHI